MSKGLIEAILLLSGLAAVLGTAAWLLLKRPLALLAWGTRRSLLATGLKKLVVPTPAGPQTVFVGGTGPVLVLLHGAGDHAGTWAQAAKALAKDHTLVIPDLAGHGDSAPATGPIDTAQIYAGLEAVLSSQAPGQAVTLVGNSLGAWMAMVVAQRHPDRVAKVVAVNGGPLLGTNTKVCLLPTNREEARATMAQLRDASSPALPGTVLDDLVRLTQTGPLARFSATAMTMGPWLLTEDQLRALHTPVRLVWGTSDQLMPLVYAQRMVAALTDVALIPIERCGHVPQQEAPARFLAALRQALGDAPQ
ncbi:MAG: alpha/beta fold hydrolase [Holophagaceae bacterium]